MAEPLEGVPVGWPGPAGVSAGRPRAAAAVRREARAAIQAPGSRLTRPPRVVVMAATAYQVVARVPRARRRTGLLVPPGVSQRRPRMPCPERRKRRVRREPVRVRTWRPPG
ncbi:hypothetical protein DMH02_014925 [Streptomyces sp. WAC 00631]|nr:hypothetical protein [Streptomyces sp. WAC 00631]MCC5034482.1 hypothetical protein [Streptomyces sp. WAC 00631]